MKRALKRGWVGVVVSLLACGASRTDQITTELNPPSEPALVYQIPIEVPDSSGALRKGVALGTKPFAAGLEEYFTTLRVRLAGETNRGYQTTSFADRVKESKKSLAARLTLGLTGEAYAFLFEDADVVGWEGPVGRLARTEEDAQLDAQLDGVGVHRAATVFYYDYPFTVTAPNKHDSPSWQCNFWAQASATCDFCDDPHNGPFAYLWLRSGTVDLSDCFMGTSAGCTTPVHGSGAYGSFYYFEVRNVRTGTYIGVPYAWLGCD